MKRNMTGPKRAHKGNKSRGGKRKNQARGRGKPGKKYQVGGYQV